MRLRVAKKALNGRPVWFEYRGSTMLRARKRWFRRVCLMIRLGLL